MKRQRSRLLLILETRREALLIDLPVALPIALPIALFVTLSVGCGGPDRGTQAQAQIDRLGTLHVKRAQFGDIDLDALELYEHAVKLDKDESVSLEEKIKHWEVVASRMPSVESEARSRIEALRDLIKERDATYAERRALLERLRRLHQEDMRLEVKRSALLEEDWRKLQRYLRLNVVSEAEKLRWVEAFIEAYGTTRELNPHIEELRGWTGRLGARFAELERAGLAEAKRQRARAAEIKHTIEELERDERDVREAQRLRLTLTAYRAQERERAARIQRRTREVGLRWLTVPGGSFMMGSHDSHEKPVHRVSLSAFRITESEVTVRQYRKCVEAGVCDEPRTGDECTWGKAGYDDHPVNCVDWGQARTFSRWVGDDLPTEAQWEYAARGGQNFTYSGSNDVDQVGWYTANSGSPTHPVKLLQKNGYGLYDMSGNVSEWTLDEYHDNYHVSSHNRAPNNGDLVWGSVPECKVKCPHGSSRRVNRGGSWRFGLKYLRVVARYSYMPDDRGSALGFRPVAMARDVRSK